MPFVSPGERRREEMLSSEIIESSPFLLNYIIRGKRGGMGRRRRKIGGIKFLHQWREKCAGRRFSLTPLRRLEPPLCGTSFLNAIFFFLVMNWWEKIRALSFSGVIQKRAW